MESRTVTFLAAMPRLIWFEGLTTPHDSADFTLSLLKNRKLSRIVLWEEPVSSAISKSTPEAHPIMESLQSLDMTMIGSSKDFRATTLPRANSLRSLRFCCSLRLSMVSRIAENYHDLEELSWRSIIMFQDLSRHQVLAESIAKLGKYSPNLRTLDLLYGTGDNGCCLDIQSIVEHLLKVEVLKLPVRVVAKVFFTCSVSDGLPHLYELRVDELAFEDFFEDEQFCAANCAAVCFPRLAKLDIGTTDLLTDNSTGMLNKSLVTDTLCQMMPRLHLLRANPLDDIHFAVLSDLVRVFDKRQETEAPLTVDEMILRDVYQRGKRAAARDALEADTIAAAEGR